VTAGVVTAGQVTLGEASIITIGTVANIFTRHAAGITVFIVQSDRDGRTQLCRLRSIRRYGKFYNIGDRRCGGPGRS
jgi:hypothetical protein